MKARLAHSSRSGVKHSFAMTFRLLSTASELSDPHPLISSRIRRIVLSGAWYLRANFDGPMSLGNSNGLLKDANLAAILTWTSCNRVRSTMRPLNDRLQRRRGASTTSRSPPAQNVFPETCHLLQVQNGTLEIKAHPSDRSINGSSLRYSASDGHAIS